MQRETGSVRSKLILMAVSTTLVALLAASIAALAEGDLLLTVQQ